MKNFIIIYLITTTLQARSIYKQYCIEPMVRSKSGWQRTCKHNKLGLFACKYIPPEDVQKMCKLLTEKATSNSQLLRGEK